jgi:hypothetical protein
LFTKFLYKYYMFLGPVAPSRGGFLVSFLVDARGGAMIGHRYMIAVL